MNSSLPRIVSGAFLALALPAVALAVKSTPDIVPPAKRQASVKLARDLAASVAPAPVAADLASPFNPPDFEKPDPSDAKASLAAGGQPGAGPAGAADRGGKAAKPPPPGDRAILEAVAARIPATGVILFGAKPILTLGGGKKVSVGDVFTVTYGEQDYDLEVVAVDRTTFTLRYRGEEITRPIRLTK